MLEGDTWRAWTHADGLGAPNEARLPSSKNTGLGTRERHDLSVLRDGRATYNPSYVFFKLEPEGPIGFLEVKLTPGRSIAVDYRLFPLPALAYIETEKPLVGGSGEIIRWEKFSRFAVSQDTGGAIRGTARSDLFWGNGTYAEIAAGHMQHWGRLYFLVLKPEKRLGSGGAK